MTLEDLGLTSSSKNFINSNNLSEFSVGRVIREDRERYIVSTGDIEYEAEITGNLRYSAVSRSDFPAVGDWVLMNVFEPDIAIINKVLPRKSVLERQAIGLYGEKQIISTNIDVAFIIQSIDNNFSINRLERYLTICYSAQIEPVLIISKVDLSTPDELSDALKNLEARERKIRTILLSNITKEGLSQILETIEKGKTYCMVGSSGVGKSSLINNLLEKNILKTDAISKSTNKGKHVTTHRQLFVLEKGGIIIDTPGMKELGITDNETGVAETFDEIIKLSLTCKFPDCTHTNEPGCAVLQAVNNNSLHKDTLENFRKIEREQERFQSTIAEKRKKDKEFGKMIKSVLKEQKKSKGK